MRFSRILLISAYASAYNKYVCYISKGINFKLKLNNRILNTIGYYTVVVAVVAAASASVVVVVLVVVVVVVVVMSAAEGITDIRQAATVKGKERAVDVFNEYLKYIKHASSSMEECDEAYLCRVETLNQFSLWILHTYRKKSSANESLLLKSKTALQYLSGIYSIPSTLCYILIIIIRS